MRTHTLSQIAEFISGDIEGDPELLISGINSLEHAQVGDISFIYKNKYITQLEKTRASAVILKKEHILKCAVNAVVVDNPYVAYAKAAALLTNKIKTQIGSHHTAVINPDAVIAENTWIGPFAVIESKVCIADDSFIGPGCVIGENVIIGKNTTLTANVTIMNDCVIGDNVLIHPGTVIGSDGFGFANDHGKWLKIPQIGTVIIGDNVEIGANVSIDRGAIENTIIKKGVKLDNNIQIGHNVVIGEDSAIAAHVGISGSTVIGERCTLGGLTGLAGHIQLGDDVHITGMGMVTKSLPNAGVYSSGLPVEQNIRWRKNIARIRNLEKFDLRLKQLEKLINQD